MTFWREEFDKLLLVGLVLLFGWSALHGQDYAQRTSDLVLGALLGLITGKALYKGGPPNPPGPVAPA